MVIIPPEGGFVIFHEASVSTFENPPGASTRVSRPQRHQERPCHPFQPPPEWAQTPHTGLSRLFRTFHPRQPPTRAVPPMGGSDTRPPRTLTFPKSRRLQRSGDFARLKTEGQRQVAGCLIFNWLPLSATPPDSRGSNRTTQVGVVTSRAVGRAVDRNRARRLLREAFRQHQHELSQPTRLVLVARQSITRRSFAAVERDFLQALRRSGLTRPTADAGPGTAARTVPPSMRP